MKHDRGHQPESREIQLHCFHIKVQNSLIFLSLLVFSQLYSSVEHMWISFCIYHKLKHNYLCVKLARALASQQKQSYYRWSYVFQSSNSCKSHDTGYMNKRHFLWGTQWKQTPSRQINFSLHRWSDQNITNKWPRWSFPSLWAEGKQKDKLPSPPSRIFLKCWYHLCFIPN